METSVCSKPQLEAFGHSLYTGGARRRVRGLCQFLAADFVQVLWIAKHLVCSVLGSQITPWTIVVAAAAGVGW